MTAPFSLPDSSRILPEGTLLRSTTGEIYEVANMLEHAGQQELYYLLKDLDPERAAQLKTLSHAEVIDAPDAGGIKFHIAKGPDKGALQQFWKKHFNTHMYLLAEVLSELDAPWRRVYTSRTIYQLFETAQALAQPLTKEEGVALIFGNFGFFPGSAPESLTSTSLFMAEKWVQSRADLKINWSKVASYLKPDFKGQVADLLKAELAADSVAFCVGEELRWFEARPLHPGADGKKAYETARLKSLITMAGEGNIFSRLPDSYEKKARVNIEGLRMAWLKRYS